MGLTSLACLNRSGIYNYWDDNWDSKLLYNRYYYGSFFIKLLILELLSGSYFNTLFIIDKKNLGYYSKYKLIYSYSYKNIFFGKTWYLKYQNWLIVIIYFFNTKVFKKKINRRKKICNKGTNGFIKNRIYKKFKNLVKFKLQKNFDYF